MPVPSISKAAQDVIAEAFKNGLTQAELVENYGLKPTTLKRILAEYALIPPLNFHKTSSEIEMLTVLTAYKVTSAEALRNLLEKATQQAVTQSVPAITNTVAAQKLDVSLFVVGGSYYNEAEGWVEIADISLEDAIFTITDCDRQVIDVFRNGKVNRGMASYNITAYIPPQEKVAK